MKSAGLVLLCVLLNSVAQLCLKIGAAGPGQALSRSSGSVRVWLEVLTSGPLLAGIALWIVSTLLWILVLSQSRLSVAYGLYGLNYLLIPWLCHWKLGEPISSLQMSGMGLVALGVGCIVAGR